MPMFSVSKPAVRKAAGFVLTMAVVAMLTGCGGASDDPAPQSWRTAVADSPASVAAAAPPDRTSAGAGLMPDPDGADPHGARPRALAANIVESTGDILFNWAERAFPSLFPGHQATLSAPPYLYRFYPGTGIYVGMSGNNVYLMGGPYGGQPVRVGTVASYWSQAVTKSPESRCWNLDLMFTGGTLVEVDWVQTGPGVRTQGGESLGTETQTEWEGAPATQFSRMFHHTDAAGNRFGRQAVVYMRRTGPDEVTWLAEAYMESDLVVGVGVRNMLNGTDSAITPRVDAHFGLTVGQAMTSNHALSSRITRVGASPADTSTTLRETHHSVTTRVVAREPIVVPAGVYDACRVEQTDAADPGRRVTTWVAAGSGIPVQRVTVESGVTVMTQRATAVRVNHKRV